MKEYKYSELSFGAKLTACEAYIEGWRETHPNTRMTHNEADMLCTDSEDDVTYDVEGNLI